jgi:hypothetical protein
MGSNAELYYDDVGKVTFSSDLSGKLNSLVKSTTTLTSKEELVKRLK